MKKIIALIISFSMLLTHTSVAIRADDGNVQYFYFNDQKYIVEMTNDLVISFTGVDSSNTIIYDSDSKIEVIQEGEKSEVVFSEDYENSGILEVTDENGVTNVINVTEVEELNYSGQAIAGSIAIGAGVIAAATLAYLIAVGIAILIGTVVHYAVAKVIENIRDYDFNKYFAATIYNKQVYIIPKDITRAAAVTRLKTKKDTYTFRYNAALSIARSASTTGATVDEIDAFRKKGYIYFWHVHPTRNAGSHAFYGFPYFGTQ